jgi:3',5'-cyclic-AMP phosphodiesterase
MTHSRPWPLVSPGDAVLVNHVSDTHFGYRPWSYAESNSMLDDYAKGLVPPVDLLLHTGDITDHGTDDEDFFAVNWLSTVGERAAQSLWTMGNHDIWVRPVHTRATWEARYGRSANTFVDVRGIRFVTFAVDSMTMNSQLWAPPESTWDWVDSMTIGFNGPVVIVNHYPPQELGVTDLNALFPPARLNELIGDNPNVIGFMCGHMHLDLSEPRLASFLTLGGRKLPVLCDISSMLSLEGQPGRDQSGRIESISSYVEITPEVWRVHYRRHGGHAWGGPGDLRVTTMDLGHATVSRGM